jgi:signal transduction histidine kinase
VSDLLVVGAAALIGVASVQSDPSMYMPLGGVTLAVELALAVSLLLRRRAPQVMIWMWAAAAVAILVAEMVSPGSVLPAHNGVDGRPWVAIATPLAAYAAVAHGSQRPGRNRQGTWAAIALLAVLAAHPWGEPVFPRLAQSMAFVAGPALFGLYVATRARAIRLLTERAERAERERHLLAEQARAEERTRLAAEMHDVVAHRVSLMILQAGALRVRTRDEETRGAAEEMRATGCQALEELRDVIGLLRRSAEGGDDDGPAAVTHAPVPDLSALVAESASVGVPVELVEEGDAPSASPVVGRTAYRVVQEALTNVRKHAPGARVEVRVRYRADGVRLTVRNTAPSGTGDPVLRTTSRSPTRRTTAPRRWRRSYGTGPTWCSWTCACPAWTAWRPSGGSARCAARPSWSR